MQKIALIIEFYIQRYLLEIRDFAGYNEIKSALSLKTHQGKMSDNFIGRKEEKEFLRKRIASKSPEFLAIYGRRRIGKTFLIRHLLEASGQPHIEVTGLKDGSLAQQLQVFSRAFSKTWKLPFPLEAPKSWMEALANLTEAIHQLESPRPFVVFLDELPWLATPKSGLLQAIDHFWNTEWSRSEKIKLIVCGSAASWIIDNIVNSKGGLHNRLSGTLLLKPFTFDEVLQYLHHRQPKMGRYQALEIYLVMGGIPFYLNHLERGLSAAQNIDQLCFHSTGLLFDEFSRLYSSLFQNSGVYVEIIRAIASQRNGMDQKTLAQKTKMASGGTLTKRLEELEAAGFILSFIPYGHKKKGLSYRIIDEYSLFYLRWIEPVASRHKLISGESSHWQSKAQSPEWKSWSGYAFEAFCYKHFSRIAGALNIRCGFEVGTWTYMPENKSEKGAQIDLIFDRDDGVINLFEIKYSNSPYRITKQYATQLGNKVDTFREKLGPKKDIHLTMISSSGILENEYSDNLLDSKISLEDF